MHACIYVCAYARNAPPLFQPRITFDAAASYSRRTGRRRERGAQFAINVLSRHCNKPASDGGGDALISHGGAKTVDSREAANDLSTVHRDDRPTQPVRGGRHVPQLFPYLPVFVIIPTTTTDTPIDRRDGGVTVWPPMLSAINLFPAPWYNGRPTIQRMQLIIGQCDPLHVAVDSR